MPWKTTFTHTFERDFRRLASEIQAKTATAIDELALSKDPRRLGHALHGKWRGYHSYRIGLQYRLIYQVQFPEKTIEFVAVGTHKIY